MKVEQTRAITGYLNRVGRARKRGDATEHTYRAFLQELIEALVKGVTCTNEPKGTQAGRPDLKVSLGETPLGYIETKDIGVDLDAIVNTSQLKRYLKEIPNLLLTDYLEFRWYQHGEPVDKVRLGTFTAKGALRFNPDVGDALVNLVENFAQAEVKSIGSPKELAQRMAALAKLTRRHVIELFNSEERKGDLHNLLRAFREVLLPDLDEESFADMYAQTVCYGLFASICNAKFPQTFARENAADNLPATNPFLRRLFHHIVGPDLHSNVREDIERIIFLLRHADIAAILKDFGKRTRQEDPVVHFYETFLAQYDPKLRKSRGVYYTPEPVVSYIVRSVDHLLKDKFGKKEGLADPSVIVLDPACGTGTFLYSVIKLIHERVESKGQYGAWNSYVRHNLLPRIFGFELLMAPYAVAHLKLGLLLRDTGYDFSGDERLGVYLTNTLEEAARKSDLLFAEYISEEANAATEVKKDKPVMVVLGNPPYSNFGQMNNGEWILGLMKDWKPVGERKWNPDDFMKFMRWAQWRIERTGQGVLAYISNNAYLDGLTHRAMRKSLARTFSNVWLLDLHGNQKRKERCPDGTKDDNVFDIHEVGVAIGLFCSGPGAHIAPSLRHADLMGRRDAKYTQLASEEVCQTKWAPLNPEAEQFFFVPKELAGAGEYRPLASVVDILPAYISGVQTKNDALFVAQGETELCERFSTALSTAGSRGRDTEDEAARDGLGWLENRGGTPKLPYDRSAIRGYALFPFDVRFIYYEPELLGRSRFSVMQHMLQANLGLAFMRQSTSPGSYDQFFMTRTLVSDRFMYSAHGAPFLAPLYVYPGASGRGEQQTLGQADELHWPAGKSGRRPNLSPEFIKEFAGKLGLEFVPDGKGDLRKTFGPEDVFNYIYAIFHSPTYRKRYAEFLKIDFPRVPLTSDKRMFRKLCALGGELVALHLMESPKLDTLATKYPKPGNNAVERVSYNDETKRVYINEDQYFEGIRPEEWEFHIGGYQVLDKWLKDRKKAKRKLSADDIRHYQRIVVAIRNTIRLMAEIDKAIPEWPVE